MRSKGSATELEKRRRLAVDRIQAGCTQVEVARVLGVEERSVRRWVAAYRGRGPQGLAARPHPGARPRLTARQQRQVLDWLKRSPTAFGFATELWTAPRVAQLIEERFAVCYHPRYLNAWLTQRGITPQKPQRQARERDPARIEAWVRNQWLRRSADRRAAKKRRTWS